MRLAVVDPQVPRLRYPRIDRPDVVNDSAMKIQSVGQRLAGIEQGADALVSGIAAGQ